MNKKIKIIIGIVLTVVGVISVPIILNLTKKEEMNIEGLKAEFIQTLQEEVQKENKKVSEEYEKKIKDIEEGYSKKVYSIMKSYAEVIGKYYTSKNNNIIVSFALDNKNAKLDFSNKKDAEYIQDNDVNERTAYSVKHSIILDDGFLERMETINIDIIRRAEQKFDIKNNKLLIDYFNLLLSREITDEEKTAINIKVNMDLGQVSSIKDLEKYIYSDESIKIDNLIIKTSKDKKGENIKIEIKKEIPKVSKEENKESEDTIK